MPSPTATKPSERNARRSVQQKAAAATIASMNDVISPAELTCFSNKSITEVEALQEEVAAVIPAGNIVGLVMGGLARLRGRKLPANHAKSDVSALLRGVDLLPRNILPRTVYGTLFVGPAAVLHTYQKLLALTGVEPEDAFPDGLWQFYLEFALREDAARHANETVGFQQAINRYNLSLSSADQLAAWVCAVTQIYFQYADLLYNEWRERVYLDLIEKAAGEANLSHKLSFRRLTQAWAAQRPYHRGGDVERGENYAQYRRRRFGGFLQSRIQFLPQAQQDKIAAKFAERAAEELPAFQRQMTIFSGLVPERYRENKNAFSLWQARIGVIFRQRYYLLPACATNQTGQPLLFETQQPNARSVPLQFDAAGHLFDTDGQLLSVDPTGQVFTEKSGILRGRLRPPPFQPVRRQVEALLGRPDVDAGSSPVAELDNQLLGIKRSDHARARRLLRGECVTQELAALKYTPVIINWDEQNRAKPLAYIRRGQRGIGDHALTLFRTSNSMVFDQSHIFFDGVWGMALAEILTGEAISWGVYFAGLPASKPANTPPYSLALNFEPALAEFELAIKTEVSAESTGVNLHRLYTVCKLLPKRHPALKLTVNDMLILYRCAFGHEYHPSHSLEDALFEFRMQDDSAAAQKIYNLINKIIVKAQAQNPALVIPMEATAAQPRERLYPTTFRNPFTELWGIYQAAAKALAAYSNSQMQEDWARFAGERRALLAQLNYFGQLVRAYKKVALEGGSTSAATIKLLAFLPDSLTKLLDEIPQRIDILNEVLKGEEVFSNMGRVARGSSISRFISAKDDNNNKTLVWAVVTDDQDVLHLALRDFRPHVAALKNVDRTDLAELIAKDYLDKFVAGFNQFTERLDGILNAAATHSAREEKST